MPKMGRSDLERMALREPIRIAIDLEAVADALGDPPSPIEQRQAEADAEAFDASTMDCFVYVPTTPQSRCIFQLIDDYRPFGGFQSSRYEQAVIVNPLSDTVDAILREAEDSGAVYTEDIYAEPTGKYYGDGYDDIDWQPRQPIGSKTLIRLAPLDPNGDYDETISIEIERLDKFLQDVRSSSSYQNCLLTRAMAAD